MHADLHQKCYGPRILQIATTVATAVMNSVNNRTVTLNKRAKARSIGSSKYKNLKLKKKEKKKQRAIRRNAFKQLAGHMSG